LIGESLESLIQNNV